MAPQPSSISYQVDVSLQTGDIYEVIYAIKSRATMLTNERP